MSENLFFGRKYPPPITLLPTMVIRHFVGALHFTMCMHQPLSCGLHSVTIHPANTIMASNSMTRESFIVTTAPVPRGRTIRPLLCSAPCYSQLGISNVSPPSWFRTHRSHRLLQLLSVHELNRSGVRFDGLQAQCRHTYYKNINRFNHFNIKITAELLLPQPIDLLESSCASHPTPTPASPQPFLQLPCPFQI